MSNETEKLIADMMGKVAQQALDRVLAIGERWVAVLEKDAETRKLDVETRKRQVDDVIDERNRTKV